MQILYTLIISVFFSGLFYYLINFALIPYTNEKILDIKNLIIVSVIFIITLASIFSLFHQIIDKVFFRKFYEKPKIILAARRGILLGILLIGLAWLRIFGFWEIHIILLVVVLVMLFEALFMSFGRGESFDESE